MGRPRRRESGAGILVNQEHSGVWGHQPLFYKFSRGSYRNLEGSVNADLNPGTDAPTQEYPFWSEAEGLGETAGKHTATIESYEALTQNHFFECVPWRNHTSPF